MLEKLNAIKNEIETIQISNAEMLENFRLKFLSKKGRMVELFEDFKKVSNENKKQFGQKINELKQEIQNKFDQASAKFNKKTSSKSNIDTTLPGIASEIGSIHPITIVQNKIIKIFQNMGFELWDGPEIEDDWHNFSALNFPLNHPARDMQDTFFVDKDIALRTHTSSIQVRAMENSKPPIRIICPGRVYRNEAISSRSHCFFHQIEGLYIDKNVSFADLKLTLYQFVKQFFGENTKVRFRPSYFPFTEPSAEMDIWLGTETPDDYRLTKGTGWLEILGCGMVDVNVLENCGIDSKSYSGFAFGMGIERTTMSIYGIKDLRLFSENDIRFLKQFKGIF